MTRRRRQTLAVVVFIVGLIFLATTGVDLVVKGQSRGETGTVTGVLLVSVAAHQWLIARR